MVASSDLAQCGDWIQLGNDIDGKSEGDWFGYSVSLSSDGKTVAAGSIYNNYRTGHVRVHQVDSSKNWIQVGNDINGESEGDWSGYSVSLSSDGKTFAVGAPYNDEPGFYSGHVRVHQVDSSNNWIQVGNEDIDGEASGDRSGYSVSLSCDGKTLAIGATYNKGNGFYSGHVRVYKVDSSNNWIQVGNDIDGESKGDRSGWSISLSCDGKTLAIGAPHNDGNGSGSGHVRVYKVDSSNNWIQVGNDIDGESEGDNSGWSVSLSCDGKTLAIGAPHNDGNGSGSGHVRVYKVDSSNNWIQVGNDIDGEASGDRSGWSVSLSSDGKTLAIGAPDNDGNNGTYSGHVRVYQVDSSNNWIQVGDDIDGESADDFSGYSVSLSSDGKTLAVGAKSNDGNGPYSGHVRVHQLVCPTQVTSTHPYPHQHPQLPLPMQH